MLVNYTGIWLHAFACLGAPPRQQAPQLVRSGAARTRVPPHPLRPDGMDRVASIARALAPAEPAAAPAPASAAEAEGPPQIDLEGGSADNWAVLVDVDEDGGLGRSVKAIRHGADADQHESSITMVEGVAMPGFCDQGRWDSLRGKLKGALRPDDVVVSTYPKCGTVRR
jgi:hypothetical protein